MVESSGTNPTPPPSGGKSEGTNEQKSQKTPHGWNPKPLTWLGMHFDEDQTKKLWSIISQNVANQISHDKDKAIEALKKLNADNNDNS